jgi:hypothetical protein
MQGRQHLLRMTWGRLYQSSLCLLFMFFLLAPSATLAETLRQNPGMPVYGLLPAEDFEITTGACGECASMASAKWFFRHETIALPRPGLPLAGFARNLPVQEDLAAWVKATPVGSARAYPPLVWLAAPQIESGVMLADDGKTIRSARGEYPLQLVDKLPLNASWFDQSSFEFLRGRPLKMRGNLLEKAFVARTPLAAGFPSAASRAKYCVACRASGPAFLGAWHAAWRGAHPVCSGVGLAAAGSERAASWTAGSRIDAEWRAGR